jgi:hypothetical protein
MAGCYIAYQLEQIREVNHPNAHEHKAQPDSNRLYGRQVIDDSPACLRWANFLRGDTMKQSGVYGIRNLINGKWYIGQTTNFEQRKKNHFGHLKGGTNGNKVLQADFLKHGKANFEFCILEYAEINMLDTREQIQIVLHQSNFPEYGYNVFKGGGLHDTAQAERDVFNDAFSKRQREIELRHITRIKNKNEN